MISIGCTSGVDNVEDSWATYLVNLRSVFDQELGWPCSDDSGCWSDVEDMIVRPKVVNCMCLRQATALDSMGDKVIRFLLGVC